MDCGFQCFTVDVPGSDPQCPFHNRAAERRASERDEVELAWREVTAEHTARIEQLEKQVADLQSAVASIRGYRSRSEE